MARPAPAAGPFPRSPAGRQDERHGPVSAALRTPIALGLLRPPAGVGRLVRDRSGGPAPSTCRLAGSASPAAPTPSPVVAVVRGGFRDHRARRQGRRRRANAATRSGNRGLACRWSCRRSNYRPATATTQRHFPPTAPTLPSAPSRRCPARTRTPPRSSRNSDTPARTTPTSSIREHRGLRARGPGAAPPGAACGPGLHVRPVHPDSPVMAADHDRRLHRRHWDSHHRVVPDLGHPRGRRHSTEAGQRFTRTRPRAHGH